MILSEVVMSLKTNYCLAAMVPLEDDPSKASIIHMCFYENPPTQNDCNSLIEELRTDQEFNMIGMEIDKDYILIELNQSTLAEIKEKNNIPDVLE